MKDYIFVAIIAIPAIVFVFHLIRSKSDDQDASKTKCPYCNGKGHCEGASFSWMCPDCQGTGLIDKDDLK